MTAHTSGSAVADFFSNWAVYRAVIDHDCMEHQDIYAAVAEILAERREPFTLLDLGCGDAAGIAPVLAGVPFARYVGVDSAEPALDFARERLATIADRVDLKVADMMEYLLVTEEKFDVILVSFALHHFAEASEKLRFLRTAHRCLRPGAEVILIDVVRTVGETRDEYIDRYCDYVGTWPLADDTRRLICRHVSGYDYPEEVSQMARIAVESGFTTVTEFYRGGRDTQAAWRLTP